MKNKPVIPTQCSQILSRTFKGFNNFVYISNQVYQMGRMFFIKLFHVLSGLDLNKAIKRNQPDNVAQVSFSFLTSLEVV